MGRLLQFSAIILLIGALVPLLEFFDRWDYPAGLSNDMEFAVHSIIVTFCLVVLVCKLVSSSAMRISVASPLISQRGSKDKRHDLGETGVSYILPNRPAVTNLISKEVCPGGRTAWWVLSLTLTYRRVLRWSLILWRFLDVC